ncbi:MAG: sulfotransferase family protein [Opitutaceae bacterium]
MSHWPNLFIAGAPRCGTTSLHAYLQDVPGIYMSRVKEPNYFSRSVIGDKHPMMKPIRDEKRYLQLFSGAGDAKVIGEATPFYLEDPEAPTLIDRTVPDAKVIVSLRDPVERLYSHYLMMRNNRPSMGSFMEEIRRGLLLLGNRRNLAVLAPATGLYSRHVERYRRVFGENRFKVIILEEWRDNVPRTLRQILAFLEIKHDVREFAEPPQRRYSEARGPVVRYLFGNRTISRASEVLIPYRLRKRIRNAILVKHVPKPPMEPEAREFLIGYYWEDVRRLERMLGRRLPWRNFALREETRQAG